GTLFIGVDDDGSVIGARHRHGDRTNPHSVAAMIQNRTEPPLATHVQVEIVGGRNVIRIDVDGADPGPIGTKQAVFTRRTIGTDGKPLCQPMSVHEIVSLGMVTRGQDYAGAVARDATVQDLDPAEFDRYRQLCRTSDPEMSRLADQDILIALGLVP